ncbi:MAG: hypothetical protein J6S14_13640 [Clostridia bacterium]|nr:hypothetical protein [Clostridia bacterium]
MADITLNTTAEKLEAAANRPITSTLSAASSDDETPTAKAAYVLNTQVADSVMSEVASIAGYSDQSIVRASNGHFYPIVPDARHTMTRWLAVLDESGNELPGKQATYQIAGSDYIKCPRYLGVYFADTTARCYLYFYKLNENGEFVNDWSVLPNATTSQQVKNYLNINSIPGNMLEFPDETYMQIFVTAGEVKLYGWDGEPFGMPLSSDTSVPVNDSDYESAFPSNGSVGVTVPGAAEYVICKNGYISALFPVSDNTVPEDYAKKTLSASFVKLPSGYDFFRVRLFPESGETIVGDVSDLISVVIPNVASETPAGRSATVIDSCKRVAGIKWSPKANVLVNAETSRTFKAGVVYNGLPYGSEWEKAHYVGWHISPHTFVNAVNDEQSIFYTDKVTNDAPYYGLVCSAFATMCAGWSYPQTNAGFVYDPDVDVTRASRPPIGDIYSNLNGGHCLIPERVDSFAGITAISAYESVTPLAVRTTRYSNIADTGEDVSGYNVNYGYDYYNRYGYVVGNKSAASHIAAPYADFDDVTIVGGSARPHRGDRSVYTSEDAVLINIKDTTAATLYLEKDGGSTVNIGISSAAQIDVSSSLNGDGIYYVYTDAGDVRESFEYRSVSSVVCTITSDGVPSFDTDDFWYAACIMKGHPLFSTGMICCVPSADNYSAWASGPARVSSAHAVFRKGTYGAYTVPVKNVYVEGSGSDEGASEVERNYNMLENKPKINGVTLAGDVSSDELGLTGGDGSGVSDHADLTGRDKADQHPVSAITGLEKRLLRPGINLLHNADWAYSLVNQRGHSGEVSGAYCIDRWIGNGTVTPVAGKYVSLAKNTTMTQRMEILPAALGDKQLCFSIDIDGEIQSVPIVFPSVGSVYSNGISLDGCDVELGYIETSGTSICNVQSTSIPYLKITPTADINVKRPFLEFGKVSHMVETPPNDYGKMLVTCLRYYIVLPRYSTAAISPYHLYSKAMAFPVPMRAKPTVVTSNPHSKNTGIIAEWSDNGGWVDFSNVNIADLTDKSCSVVSNSASFITGKEYTWTATADAEL